MKKTIGNNVLSLQQPEQTNNICHLLNEVCSDTEDRSPGGVSKIERLQYIEGLLCSMVDMAKQSGETFLVHLLNMTLLETRDRRRNLAQNAKG